VGELESWRSLRLGTGQAQRNSAEVAENKVSYLVLGLKAGMVAANSGFLTSLGMTKTLGMIKTPGMTGTLGMTTTNLV